MSDTFTASNGVRVTRRGESVRLSCEFMANRIATFDALNMQDMDALREFFLHERDKELGRWRWPERPEYVVYPKKPSMTEPEPGLRVVHETTGRSRDIRRSAIETYDAILSVFGVAARAYFDAHPEPRPWHDAKPGEVWVLTLEGEPETAQVVDGYGKFMPWTIDVVSDGNARGKITAGRRIFPEVSP